MADQRHDLDAKDTMLKIADGYDWLGKMAVRRLAHPL
jgi:hypothetical protein